MKWMHAVLIVAGTLILGSPPPAHAQQPPSPPPGGPQAKAFAQGLQDVQNRLRAVRQAETRGPGGVGGLVDPIVPQMVSSADVDLTKAVDWAFAYATGAAPFVDYHLACSTSGVALWRLRSAAQRARHSSPGSWRMFSDLLTGIAIRLRAVRTSAGCGQFRADRATTEEERWAGIEGPSPALRDSGAGVAEMILDSPPAHAQPHPSPPPGGPSALTLPGARAKAFARGLTEVQNQLRVILQAERRRPVGVGGVGAPVVSQMVSDADVALTKAVDLAYAYAFGRAWFGDMIVACMTSGYALTVLRSAAQLARQSPPGSWTMFSDPLMGVALRLQAVRTSASCR